MKSIVLFSCAAIVFCFALSCSTGSGTVIVRDTGQLWGREGARVVIEGRVAREIWQHMTAPTPDYPHEVYVDLGTGQIVIYAKTPVACGGMVRASGTIVKLEGSSKNPRRKETCTEYHVNVDAWECVR